MESEILPSKWELIDTLWNVNVNILEKIEALEVEN